MVESGGQGSQTSTNQLGVMYNGGGVYLCMCMCGGCIGECPPACPLCSCCVDEVAAQHADADCVIHFGPSCLTR